MTAFLLSVHVLAAILTIGPVAIAASMFPPAARAAAETPRDSGRLGTVRLLHRITRVYTIIGVFVPVFGVATGASLGVLSDTWLIISMVLTTLAAVLLAVRILPRQGRIVTALETSADTPPEVTETGKTSRRLAMHTGIFNILWAIVVVLMIYRPGSTTGAGL